MNLLLAGLNSITVSNKKRAIAILPLQQPGYFNTSQVSLITGNIGFPSSQFVTSFFNSHIPVFPLIILKGGTFQGYGVSGAPIENNVISLNVRFLPFQHNLNRQKLFHKGSFSLQNFYPALYSPCLLLL